MAGLLRKVRVCGLKLASILREIESEMECLDESLIDVVGDQAQSRREYDDHEGQGCLGYGAFEHEAGRRQKACRNNKRKERGKVRGVHDDGSGAHAADRETEEHPIDILLGE